MVTPCINDIKSFIVQLMHMQSLLKQIKIKKAALTCFVLQGNHHQGASQRLAKIIHLVHVCCALCQRVTLTEGTAHTGNIMQP